jgi:hypothetical protein
MLDSTKKLNRINLVNVLGNVAKKIRPVSKSFHRIRESHCPKSCPCISFLDTDSLLLHHPAPPNMNF